MRARQGNGKYGTEPRGMEGWLRQYAGQSTTGKMCFRELQLSGVLVSLNVVCVLILPGKLS